MQGHKPNIIKNYEPLRIAGTLHQVAFGAFGIVQLAKCLKTDQIVAIKKIKRKVSENQLQMLKKIKHPNIIRLLDYHMDPNNNQIQLIYEYFQGRTLFEYIKNRKFKDKYTLNTIFGGICEALSYLHSLNTHNFGLKPENIYLFEKNMPKICYIKFSLTKAPRLSIDRNLYYSSPQIIWKKEITYKSDIWELGILLYQIFQGRMPFKGLNQSQIYQSMKEGSYISKNMFYGQPKLYRQILKINPQQRLQLAQIMRRIDIKQNSSKIGEFSKVQTQDEEYIGDQKIKLVDIKQYPSKRISKIQILSINNISQRRTTQAPGSPTNQNIFRHGNKPPSSYSLQNKPKISLKRFLPIRLH